MYLKYFGLEEAPFSIAPDPRYLYMSRRHQEALAHLLYGVRNGGGGFVLLTGEVGAGKTTVCRCLLEQIPENCDIAYIFNPKLTVEELLSTLCIEFGIDVPAGNHSIKVFIDSINAFLLDAHARGRHAVLIIDEAQNLSAEVLEQMRLLTNLETNERKLLQIILLGQPELAEMLDRPELRQLAQRIVARYHLGSLNKAEVVAYLHHRLEVSGIAAGTRQLIPANLAGAIHRLSGGVPRLINVLCDRALLGTYVQGKAKVDRATLKQAAAEVFPTATGGNRRKLLAMAILVVLLIMAAGMALHRQSPLASAAAPKAPLPVHKEVMPKLVSPGIDIIVWPGDVPPEQSQQLAYAAMFKAWGIADAAANTCSQVVRSGFDCRSEFGKLKDLRQINRPVVVQLRDGGNRQQTIHATLVGLNKGTATLVLGGSTVRAELAALADQWTGHYTVLWRKPQEVQVIPRRGEKGPAVAWVNRQLALYEGKTVDMEQDPVMDDAMVRRIRQFQIATDLEPDGAVGTRTLIRLAGVGDPNAPALLVEEEGARHVLHP